VSDRKNHDLCTRRFIELANDLMTQGQDRQLVNAALMAASGIFLTYTVAGNAGALNPSGVDKAVALFRRNLEHIQKRKKEEVGGQPE
jgi:hypothetical protein